MALYLGIALAGIAVAAAASLAIGSEPISPDLVLHAVRGGEALPGSPEAHAHAVVIDQRLPRTILGIAAGAALGLAGALMQALTRNPLADPGLLGINAGATFAVVLSITYLGVGSPAGYVWFALPGALLGALVVYSIGAAGRDGPTPVRLALSGIAVSAVLIGLTSGLLLSDIDTFDGYRVWTVGALAGRRLTGFGPAFALVAAGSVVALALGRSLNVIGMGEDLARSLGVNVARTRLLSVAAVTLLCGATTAMAGPIGFVGLMVPHLARAITGHDQRWALPFSGVFGVILVLASDIVGRVVAHPTELQLGLVTAFVGGPVLVGLARSTKLNLR